MAETIKDRKRRDLLLARGIPSIVDATPAIKRVRLLRDVHYMTFTELSRQSRVAYGALYCLYRGHGPMTRPGEPYTVRRSTLERVMAVPVPAAPLRPVDVHSGPLLPACGARRRYDMLALRGFPGMWINARYFGMQDKSLWRFYGVEHVKPTAHLRMVHAYDDLTGKTPDDFGIALHTQSIARGYAEKRNAAPEHCWDESTLDDPDAIAEWTGMCGTKSGYSIHKREGHIFWKQDGALFVRVIGCDPCRKANSSVRGNGNKGKADSSVS